MREVPDHQEVWADDATDASLIVELVERVEHVAVRAAAVSIRARRPLSAASAQDSLSARFFWEDVARLNDAADAVRSACWSSVLRHRPPPPSPPLRAG